MSSRRQAPGLDWQGGLQPPLAVQTWRLTPTGHPSGSSVALSNTLNLPRRSQSASSGGAGIPAGKPGRLPLENSDFGSVLDHLAQLAWSPPRRLPGGKFGFSRRLPRSRPASPPAAQRPPPRPPGASSPAAQGFLPAARISSSTEISSRLYFPGHSGHSRTPKNMPSTSLGCLKSITFYAARSCTI